MARADRDGAGWTLDTLNAHFSALLAEKDRRDQQRYDAQTKALDAAFLAQETAVQAALLAAEKAVTKAEVAAEKRFDGVNEFRQLVTDLVREQMPRVEAEQRLVAMTEKIDELKSISSQRAGHSAGLQTGWGLLVGAFVIVAGVASIVGYLVHK